jgi:D-amino peptidase
MVNLLVDDLPEYVEIVRGYPRPVSMVSGIEDCAVAVFLGYHAKFGTAKSTWDHTYSGGTINKVEVNGIAASEFLLNAYVAGESDVPVILVAGEAQLLQDDVKQYAPWAETVALKHSLSRLAAKSSSMTRIEQELKAAVKRAVKTFRQRKAKPLTARTPVQMGVTFLGSHFADAAELLPMITRTDGLNAEYAASNMVEAYKIFELLVLAAFAYVTLFERLK